MRKVGEIPQILFWKWDDSHIQSRKYIKDIDDICERSGFNYIYVGTAWCSLTLESPILKRAITEAVTYTHDRGRKFILEIDVRPCRNAFVARHPESRTGMVFALEDEIRHSDVVLSHEFDQPADQFGRYGFQSAEVLRVYAFKLLDSCHYDEETLIDITHLCEWRMHERTLSLSINTDTPQLEPGMRVFAVTVGWYEYPDPASPDTWAFTEKLFELYADIALDGVALDEWGYFPHSRNGGQFYFDEAWKSPWYSLALQNLYAETTGRDLIKDYLVMRYAPEGSDESRIVAINEYTDLIRQVTVSFEDRYYEACKEYFGEDAFVGVHPTWYGLTETDNTPEIWKNALNWWDVTRDYGQTDESISLPVRAALSHKWNSPIWLNMWYGNGTLDLGTYFKEGWTNARFGGRTHTLAYECRLEPSVLDLKEKGYLERIWEMEERIMLLNSIATHPLDCRVGIVLGYYAATNWLCNVDTHGCWHMKDCVLSRTLEIAMSVWNAGFLCDVIPDYEIADGDLNLKEGKARYGNQEYDLLIYVYPELSKKSTILLLDDYASAGGKLGVIGNQSRFQDGALCSGEFKDLVDKAMFWKKDMPAREELQTDLCKCGLVKNQFDNGAVLQNGWLVFTGTGEQHVDNPIHIDLEYMNHLIRGKAMDVLAFKIGDDGVFEGPIGFEIEEFCVTKT